MYPESVMCLAYTSKKCEFWRPHLRGTPIVVLPNLSNFIFSYLPILKISSVQGEWFSFEFWRLCLRRIPSFWYSQISSNFSFLRFCLSWQFHQSSVSGSIFSFGVLVWRGFLHFGTLKFFLFFIFACPKNFMGLAWVVVGILAALFEGYAPFWYTQTLWNSTFSSYLPTLKFSCV